MRRLAFLLVIFLIAPISIVRAATDSQFGLFSIMFHGIACETYVNGTFVEGKISKVHIDLDKNIMNEIIFSFVKGYKISVYTKSYYIDKVEKKPDYSGQVTIRGKNEEGLDFVASASRSSLKGEVNFIIVTEGRVRVEVKNISKKGLNLKNKYLKQIDLGYINY